MAILFPLLIWISLSVAIGFAGAHRKIGSTKAFLISIIFSPLLGLVFVALSQRKSDIFHNSLVAHNMMANQKSNKEVITDNGEEVIRFDVDDLPLGFIQGLVKVNFVFFTSKHKPMLAGTHIIEIKSGKNIFNYSVYKNGLVKPIVRKGDILNNGDPLFTVSNA